MDFLHNKYLPNQSNDGQYSVVNVLKAIISLPSMLPGSWGPVTRPDLRSTLLPAQVGGLGVNLDSAEMTFGKENKNYKKSL